VVVCVVSLGVGDAVVEPPQPDTASAATRAARRAIARIDRV
jgi:hypothetical protein